MGIAQDLVLVSTDPSSGKIRLSAMSGDTMIGGAFLLDLVAQGRLVLDGAGKKARVVVADRTPVDDPVLQAAFVRVQGKDRQKPQAIVGTLGKKGRKRVVEQLSAAGRLRSRGQKVLGIRVERVDVVDTAARESLLHGVRSVLLTGHPADGRTGPLIGLLLAGEQLGLVLDRSEVKRAKPRAKEVAEADWASEGVRQAIAATNAVLMTTVIAAGAAAAGSS